MEIQDFIDQNREELSKLIDDAISYVPKEASCDCPLSGTNHHHKPEPMDDNEITDWVMNDESLYNWAIAEGVDV